MISVQIRRYEKERKKDYLTLASVHFFSLWSVTGRVGDQMQRNINTILIYDHLGVG